METIEQVDEKFDVKKPKKKGILIGGIITGIVVIALVLVYFLVLTKPQFIFSKAIDRIFKMDLENYDSIKADTKIKASVEAEDEAYDEYLKEIEKVTIKAGTQMDVSEKKEIVELGLEYDNETVADAQIYYNDGEMYAYLEGLFDKYIEMDMDEETKEQLSEMFESATSEEDLKKSKKALEIFGDELKTEIIEEGTFKQEKETIDVGDKEQKLTKSTLVLSEKQLLKVLSNVCANLAENDEFIEIFDEDIVEEDLKELSKLIKQTDANSKNKVEISIYTKGLNSVVAVELQVYVEEEETTIVMLVVKEDKDVYSYSVSGKFTGAKVDLVNGKVEIEKDKESKKEKSGKVIITAEVFETGNAKIEIDYAIEYNNGIDKINTKNSVKMDEITEAEMQAIMIKLSQRPLIGNLLTTIITTNENLYEKAEDAAQRTEEAMISESIALAKVEILADYYSNQITENQITEQKVKESVESYLGTAKDYNVEVIKTNGKLEFTITVNGIENKMDLEGLANVGQEDNSEQITTLENEVRSEDHKYSVTYSVPNDFEFDKYFSSDDAKYYYSDINNCNVYVGIEEKTDSEFIEYIKSEYEFVKGFEGMNDGHKNFNLNQINTLKMGDKEFKYQTIEYETNDYKSQEVYVWYLLGDKHLFTVKLDITDKENIEDIIKGFLDINVKEI